MDCAISLSCIQALCKLVAINSLFAIYIVQVHVAYNCLVCDLEQVLRSIF